MSRFFLTIYNFFETRRALMYGILVLLTLLMAFLASKINFNEDVTSIFPDEDKKTSVAFKNLKAKDKIVVMFTLADSTAEGGPDRQIECSEIFIDKIEARIDSAVIESIVSSVDDRKMHAATDFIYNNLPIFLTDKDFAALDSITAPQATDGTMNRNYQNIISPIGSFVGEYLYRDPLGISGQILSKLQSLNSENKYQMYDDHIFSSDMQTMLVFINPRFGMGKTDKNDILVKAIESAISEIDQTAEWNDVQVTYFGGPAVAAYNARQIKFDTMVTLNVALLIILIATLLVFRNKWAILLILLPVIFGGLFSLAMIYLIMGKLSVIAAGSGAAVLGIAMSYSIHIISHSNNTSDPRQIIREMAYPLTVGSFTTIGAFLGLTLTSSQLLRDFGLFSAFTLIGTTIFSLVFLPHFITSNKERKSNKLLQGIEKITDYAFDRNKWLIIGVVVLTTVCLFFYNDVKFDSDMMNLNFEPKHLQESQAQLNAITGDGDNSNVLLVSVNDDVQKAIVDYKSLQAKYETLKLSGDIVSYSSIADFVIPDSLQKARIERWNNYWSDKKKDETMNNIRRSASRLGFRDGAFDRFADLLSANYKPYDYANGKNNGLLLDEWINSVDSTVLFLSHIVLPGENKDKVYSAFEDDTSATVVDRSFYAGKMAGAVSDDFNLTLFISSILIFVALLLSFGRIELTLLAFLPMLLSWVIILGLMALLNIEFNIVNIILSTFIFGIGDDFSIFIMDGLLCEYKNGKKMLSEHKTAIVFSAFTIIVGMGSLIFAQHPALKSIALISILGIISVVIVSFTIQPIIFRAMVTSQTKKGGFPYTLGGLLNTLYAFGLFVIGCFLLQFFIIVLHLIPIKRKRRKYVYHWALCWSTRVFLKIMIFQKKIVINQSGEDFSTPAVIVANHQSFIDILMLLSLNPKILMVTNNWVWKSPFFGRIVRYSDFYHAEDGYEKLADTLKSKIEDGYSILIFPEGTRSQNNTIGRFHKGAFYLAELLNMDILPIPIYGNGLISSKKQPLYIKKGVMVSKILPRITTDDTRFGTGYSERTKKVARWFREEYHVLYEEYNRTTNKYFPDALIKNYIFKGPVLEWYMRIKTRMEGNYKLFDELIPRTGYIVDIGCGYGPLSYMLAMLSERREVLGLDYDEEKIALANHSYSKNDNINFIYADAASYELPVADAYIMNDVLHYMDYDSQDKLVSQCIEKVKTGGMVVIRDGDSSKAERHRVTKNTEKWSTEIIGFNKTVGGLHFTSTERITAVAEKHNAQVRIINNDNVTSNTIYVITKGDGTV